MKVECICIGTEGREAGTIRGRTAAAMLTGGKNPQRFHCRAAQEALKNHLHSPLPFASLFSCSTEILGLQEEAPVAPFNTGLCADAGATKPRTGDVC